MYMMKQVLTLILLMTIGSVFAQDNTLNFKPRWKVGEKKEARIVQKETEYKNGELISDTTMYGVVEITVTGENKENYMLKVVQENVAMRSVINFYDKLGEELPDYQKLKLKYQVNKKTGEGELTNWKEANEYINNSFEQINALIEKKVPEMAAFTNIIFAPIKNMFKDKESIEAYMSEEIGYLIAPFGKNFVAGDTLKINDSAPNPFNPMDTVSATTLFYISENDEAQQVCTINKVDLLDMSSFVDMMKQMMTGMAKSFGVADSSMESKMNELDDIKFDIQKSEVITFDYKNSWPQKVVGTGKVTSSNPKESRVKTVVRTITIM